MQKIVQKTLRCGTTGKYFTVSQLVTIKSKDQEAIEAIRRANEERLDREAEIEAMAIRNHRRIMPSVQKIGWRAVGV